MVNELVIVGLIETIMIRRESFGNDMSKEVEHLKHAMTDFEFVVDRQVPVTFASIHDVL